MANLMIDVLRSQVRSGRFSVHEFVIMPNHIHVLMTIPGSLSLEKSMQLIKGGFSYRAHRELGFQHAVWQRGYSDVRITDAKSFEQHCEYIAQNPVKAGLALSTDDYVFGSRFLKKRKQAAAKAESNAIAIGTTEVVP